MSMLDDIREALKRIDDLPARPVRVWFRSKHDMLHLLNEPEVRVQMPWQAPDLLAIPVFFDESLGPYDFKFDYAREEGSDGCSA